MSLGKSLELEGKTIDMVTIPVDEYLGFFDLDGDLREFARMTTLNGGLVKTVTLSMDRYRELQTTNESSQQRGLRLTEELGFLSE